MLSWSYSDHALHSSVQYVYNYCALVLGITYFLISSDVRMMLTRISILQYYVCNTMNIHSCITFLTYPLFVIYDASLLSSTLTLLLCCVFYYCSVLLMFMTFVDLIHSFSHNLTFIRFCSILCLFLILVVLAVLCVSLYHI